MLFIGVSYDHSMLHSDTARQEACYGETGKGSTSVSMDVTLQASLSRLPKKWLTSCPKSQGQRRPSSPSRKAKSHKNHFLVSMGPSKLHHPFHQPKLHLHNKL